MKNFHQGSKKKPDFAPFDWNDINLSDEKLTEKIMGKPRKDACSEISFLVTSGTVRKFKKALHNRLNAMTSEQVKEASSGARGALLEIMELNKDYASGANEALATPESFPIGSPCRTHPVELPDRTQTIIVKKGAFPICVT